MENIFSRPGPLHKYAVIVDGSESRHFVATDNLSGWLDLRTGDCRFGTCTGIGAAEQDDSIAQGYMVIDRFVLKAWRLVPKNSEKVQQESRAATSVLVREEIYPWGSRRLYSSGMTEASVLWSGHRILSLGLGGAKDQRFEPIWSEDGRLDPPTGHMVWPEVRLGSSTSPALRAAMVSSEDESWNWLHLCFAESPEELAETLGQVHRKYPGKSPLAIHLDSRIASLDRCGLVTGNDTYDKALWWARASARSMVVNEFGPGIWAGLPWFKDNWGRDTFIALPGTLLVQGEFTQARAVLENFARFQNLDEGSVHYGRIPNRVNRHEILYNTVDGTPWLIREIYEYLLYTGHKDFALAMVPLVDRYIQGALRFWVDEHGLLCHDDADTWMDARIEGKAPWSPRGNRAAEIQILWQTALWVGAELAELSGAMEKADDYRRLSAKSLQSFLRFFVLDGRIVDRIHPDGVPDGTIRPNVLMLSWIPFVPSLPAHLLDQTLRQSLETLLVPWGIMSLDPASPHFHPRHVSPAFHHKDAAYHNGTIWAWNAGFAITALCRLEATERAWALSKNLANQILDLATVGTMSELLDAVLGPDGRPRPSGTFSQAWSVSEFARNAVQDYLGYRPDLLHGSLTFMPTLPNQCLDLKAELPLGLDGLVIVEVHRRPAQAGKAMVEEWSFSGLSHGLELALWYRDTPGQKRCVQLSGGSKREITIVVTIAEETLAQALEPDPRAAYHVESGRDVLKRTIEAGLL